MPINESQNVQKTLAEMRNDEFVVNNARENRVPAGSGGPPVPKVDPVGQKNLENLLSNPTQNISGGRESRLIPPSTINAAAIGHITAQQANEVARAVDD